MCTFIQIYTHTHNVSSCSCQSLLFLSLFIESSSSSLFFLFFFLKLFSFLLLPERHKVRAHQIPTPHWTNQGSVQGKSPLWIGCTSAYTRVRTLDTDSPATRHAQLYVTSATVPHMSAWNKKEGRAGGRDSASLQLPERVCLSVEFRHSIKTPSRELRRFVAGVWILSHISIYGNCGGQNSTGNVFLQVFRFFSFWVSFHGCPHSPITDNTPSQ